MQAQQAYNRGRVWMGYCLTIAAPAVGWVLEDRGVPEIQARMICMAVLVAGVLLTCVGVMILTSPSSKG